MPHWEIFARLCRHAKAKGDLIADAYLAAMAIESGCEWVSTDGDYERFNDLVLDTSVLRRGEKTAPDP